MTTKSKKEIEKMKEGGLLLSRALQAAANAVRPGVKMKELDAIAEKVLRDGGGVPAFKGYKTRAADSPYPATLCISKNNEVVHGIGTREDVLNEGDIVGLDIGVKYKGLYTDMATTVAVGKVSDEAKKLMTVTKEALKVGIGVVRGGGTVGEVGKAIESFVKPYGYGIVRDLVGHGVGHDVHEDPHVPNFYDPRYDKLIFKKGVTIAVEPMLTLGDWRIDTASDGWTIVTQDGSISAHYEVTIVVTEDGFDFITPLVG